MAIAKDETPELLRRNLLVFTLDAQLLVENVPRFIMSKAGIICFNRAQGELCSLGRQKTMFVFVRHVDNRSNDVRWQSLVKAKQKSRKIQFEFESLYAMFCNLN